MLKLFGVICVACCYASMNLALADLKPEKDLRDKDLPGGPFALIENSNKLVQLEHPSKSIQTEMAFSKYQVNRALFPTWLTSSKLNFIPLIGNEQEPDRFISQYEVDGQKVAVIICDKWVYLWFQKAKDKIEIDTAQGAIEQFKLYALLLFPSITKRGFSEMASTKLSGGWLLVAKPAHFSPRTWNESMRFAILKDGWICFSFNRMLPESDKELPPPTEWNFSKTGWFEKLEQIQTKPTP